MRGREPLLAAGVGEGLEERASLHQVSVGTSGHLCWVRAGGHDQDPSRAPTKYMHRATRERSRVQRAAAGPLDRCGVHEG